MSDPHPQGGDLFDMAKDGTKGKRFKSPRIHLIQFLGLTTYTSMSTVPPDAAKPNYIKSVANPDQKKDSTALETAALNEVPLGSTRLGEVVSATGSELPEDIGDKYRMHGGKERPGGHAPHTGRNQPTHG